MNEDLKEYIRVEIFPKYEKFYAHGMIHINNVIKQSMLISVDYDVNLNMVYTIACYHDLGLNTKRDDHEKESGKILVEDINLRDFFTLEEIMVMKEAIEDHRGSRKVEPRSIYGKIVSDADRDFDIEILAKRQLATSIKNYPNLTSFDEHFERCYKYISDRKNKEGQFNLWTNSKIIKEKRDNFDRMFSDKEYSREIYRKEYNKIIENNLIDKIRNYYEDY